jgi:hypothetical protein
VPLTGRVKPQFDFVNGNGTFLVNQNWRMSNSGEEKRKTREYF